MKTAFCGENERYFCFLLLLNGQFRMKASDLFIKSLENEGVEYIFGIPGEENLDFLDSLQSSPIQLILTRHEQGAAFMAATYGRLTGKPGVCLSTLGPGRHEFCHRSGLCTARGDAFDYDYGSKAY